MKPPELREIHGDFTCPACGRPNEVLGGVNTRGPKPGDVVVCVACLVYLVITDDHKLQTMSDADWLQLSPTTRQRLAELRERMEELDLKP